MRRQVYRTRAHAPGEQDITFRACGVKKILESGLAADDPLSKLAIAFITGMPSAGSTRVYGYNIGHWFQWCLARGLDPADTHRLDARAYLADLSGRAPKTRVQILASLQSLYDEAIEEDLARRNPFLKVKRPPNEPITPTPALDFDEFKRLLAVIRSHFGHPDRDLCARRDFAMIYLMGRLGLRRKEVRELRWGDMRGDGVVILTVHGKGDKYAEMRVPPDVHEVVGGWRETLTEAVGRTPDLEHPVFPVLGGARGYKEERALPLADYSVGSIVRKRMIDAGFDGPRYGAHALRATAATIADQNGADLMSICRLLRHSNPKTTEGYIKTSNARRTSAADVWRGPDFELAS